MRLHICEDEGVTTPERQDQLFLIRHGETEWSKSGRHTSTTDLPLTAEGERVAASLKEKLAGETFELVLTSPRQRARRTAELAGFGDAEVDDDLVEWDYGDYEGITTAEIRETVPGWTVWADPVPNGETPPRSPPGSTASTPASPPYPVMSLSSVTPTRCAR